VPTALPSKNPSKMMTSCAAAAAWQAQPRLAMPRGNNRGSSARRSTRVVTHAAQAGHNHRAQSPQKSRPSANLNPNTTNTTATSAGGNGSSGNGSLEPTRASSSSGSGGSSTVQTTTSTATCATFQRASWYGSVSSNSPPMGRGMEMKTQAAAGADGAGGGGGGGGGSSRGGAAEGTPNTGIVKQATEGAAPVTNLPKPFVEPKRKPNGELKLPRESDAKGASKPILTRLLRTPLSGGVLNTMKDAELPSVAVAARNLMVGGCTS
jgi:hypothetical protein